MGIEPLPEPEEEICFESFWLLYPRKESKKDAAKAWAQTPEDARATAIIAAANWRREWARQEREVHKIKLPATWLRGECWEDELPTPAYTHQSQVPAEREAPHIRSELPQKVRDLIAKMKTKR